MGKFYHLVKYPGGRWQVRHLATHEYNRIRQEAEVSSNGYRRRGVPDSIAKKRNENRYLMD